MDSRCSMGLLLEHDTRRPSSDVISCGTVDANHSERDIKATSPLESTRAWLPCIRHSINTGAWWLFNPRESILKGWEVAYVKLAYTSNVKDRNKMGFWIWFRGHKPLTFSCLKGLILSMCCKTLPSLIFWVNVSWRLPIPPLYSFPEKWLLLWIERATSRSLGNAAYFRSSFVHSSLVLWL